MTVTKSTPRMRFCFSFLVQVASAKAEGASELYGALDESALVAVGERILVEQFHEIVCCLVGWLSGRLYHTDWQGVGARNCVDRIADAPLSSSPPLPPVVSPPTPFPPVWENWLTPTSLPPRHIIFPLPLFPLPLRLTNRSARGRNDGGTYLSSCGRSDQRYVSRCV